MVPPDGHSNAALSVMYAEVARIMGRPMLSEDIQVSPPNHPVALLNWWRLTLMLAEQPATKQEAFRGYVVFGQPPREVPELTPVDAHCHLHQLQAGV